MKINIENHQKWLKNWCCKLKGWHYEMLLGELTEAKVAGCDYCIRKIKKEIKIINNYDTN